MELRFDRTFHGVTQAGIGFGMSEKAVRAAYGDPEYITKQGSGTKYEWTSKGLLIWFANDRVNQIVVFQPK